MTTMLGEALLYAKRRVPIFPCVPLGKQPLTPQGFKNASCNQEQVRKWWTKWPDANIGMPTGLVGPTFQTADIIDVDVRPNGNGYDTYKEMRKARYLDGVFAVVKTPSGGAHIYFQPTQNGCGRLRDRFIDYKAVGGYVLLPPSQVVTEFYSGTYELVWKAPSFTETYQYDHKINWQAIKDKFDPPVYIYKDGELVEASYTIDWLALWIRKQKEGNRNNGLHWAVNRALESGFTDLQPLVDAALEIGLDKEEVTATVNSVTRSAGGPNGRFGGTR